MTLARRRRAARAAVAAAVAVVGVACASPPPPPPPAPPIDAEQVALRLEGTTQPHEPVRIFFQWSMSDRDSRFQGRGVARIEPPYKARLDLFLSNGETAVRAALVDDDLRLPEGMPEGFVPPAEMLWGTLGVFRPGRETALRSGDALGGGKVRLTYRRPDGIDLRFTVMGGRIEEIERLKQGSTVERVTITPGDQDRYPSSAAYRDLPAFRELKLTRERVEQVEAFPPDIWDLRP